MGFKCGIVGLPNVGKSTIFNALTAAKAEIANYPFCTIEPNVGVVMVPDERLEQLAKIVNPQKIVPTLVEFVDIAGLVKGASEGEGLGNKFLANIRETQAILHVVRCFDDSNIVHVAGKVDPIKDVETINLELILSDLEVINRAIIKLEKLVKAGDKGAESNYQQLLAAQKWLNGGKKLIGSPLDQTNDFLNSLNLLTTKPTLYLANVDEISLKNNPHVEVLENLAKEEGARVVMVSAKLEAELSELTKEEKAIFLAELGLLEGGLERVIRGVYLLLGLQTYFTAGIKEVRAWTIKKGMNAKQAAGVIHSDFERGFIAAEVVSYGDYLTYQGVNGAKEHGKLHLEGRDYLMQDGDVVLFRFNV